MARDHNRELSSWTHLLERAGELAEGRDVARLSNLALAAQAGARSGLLGRRRRSLDGAGLAEAVQDLAVEPIAVADCSSTEWCALADTALDTGAGERWHMDAWVQAFQSADPARKSRGAYATPEALAGAMAERLLGCAPDARRIVDPAAGAGSLLVAVLRELMRSEGTRSAVRRAVRRLYGVELDPVARELACLLLWLTAEASGIATATIAAQVTVDNAVTRDWWVEDRFDGLIMNPPWESLRQTPSVGEPGPDEPGHGIRDATLRRLLVQARGDHTLPPLYSAQGRGDKNLYKAFVELAPHLLAEGGRLVALIPGAWSSDLGTAPLRRLYLAHLGVERWTSFENRRGYFPIDSRYKFGILTASRNSRGTRSFKTVAFADDVRDLASRHAVVRRRDLRVLGGPAEIVPDLTSAAECRLLMHYHRTGLSFFGGQEPLGRVEYRREVDLTEDRKRGRFHRLADLDPTADRGGGWVDSDGNELVPLMEGRMVGAYDFYAKSWVSGAGRTACWSWSNGHRLAACRPQFLIPPCRSVETRVAICDVTSATNTRTVLATWVPARWRCGNTAPVLVFDSERQGLAGLAILNSMVFDWFARRLVAGLHLNRFYLETMRWPRLSVHDVDRLAAAAAMLTRQSPRYRDLAKPRLAQKPLVTDYIGAHVLIERTVARGYALTHAALARVYSASSRDRRGLWRHFVADPNAASIVAAVMSLDGQPSGSPMYASIRR